MDQLRDILREHDAFAMHADFDAMQARVGKLEAGLAQAAEWFREYEAIHTRKRDTVHSALPQHGLQEKIDRNRERAEFCESALQNRNPGHEGGSVATGEAVRPAYQDWRLVDAARSLADWVTTCEGGGETYFYHHILGRLRHYLAQPEQQKDPDNGAGRYGPFSGYDGQCCVRDADGVTCKLVEWHTCPHDFSGPGATRDHWPMP